MSTTYTTLADLVDREITPALTDVDADFATDAFVQAMRDADLVVWTGKGFEQTADPDTFWQLVQAFDTAAMTQVAEITEALPDLDYDGTEGFVVEAAGEYAGQAVTVEQAQQLAVAGMSQQVAALVGIHLVWTEAEVVDTFGRRTWSLR